LAANISKERGAPALTSNREPLTTVAIGSQHIGDGGAGVRVGTAIIATRGAVALSQRALFRLVLGITVSLLLVGAMLAGFAVGIALLFPTIAWVAPGTLAATGLLLAALCFWNVGRAAANANERREHARAGVQAWVTRTLGEAMALDAHELILRADDQAQQVGSPMLTLIELEEILRLVVLEFRRQGEARHRHGLEQLERAIEALRKGTPTTMSLAEVDRLFAYRQSQTHLLIAITLGLGYVLWAAITGHRSPNVLAAAGGLLLAPLLYALLGSVRARSMWSTNPRASSAPILVLDLLLLATISPEHWAERYWAVYLAPLWELPYAMRPSFGRMHAYRWAEARLASGEVHRLLRDVDLARRNGGRASKQLNDRVRRAASRLYAITSDERMAKLALIGANAEDE
jgi:hypothetical protein